MDIHKYLDAFQIYTQDPVLDAMLYFMDEFSNPELKYKIIHVAGTNGKGSVCEMLTNCLICNGYTVGKFVSPELLSFNDSICVNNISITDLELEEIVNELKPKIDKYNMEHKIKVKRFEVITSVALIYFAKKQCDFVVLETGLGGRDDCTNIVNPLISAITSISYDHMNILGNTLEQIATIKAGIIKNNSDTVFMYQEDIIEIIKKTCNEKNNTLHLINQLDIANYSYNDDLQKFDFKEYKNVLINLRGKVQVKNASICLEVLDVLKSKGYNIDEAKTKEGLKNIIHKARFEVIKENPTIIFDGGHNKEAVLNLIDMIKQYYIDTKKIYIISLLTTKDYESYIKHIVKDNDSIFYFTDGTGEAKYVKGEQLLEIAKKHTTNKKLYNMSIQDAIGITVRKYGDRTIFIIGSFYVYKKVVEFLG